MSKVGSQKSKRTTATFDLEQQYWKQNIAHVAGIDEAGMGAWAGPVVAAAVVFDSRAKRQDTRDKIQTAGIRDSKLLTPKQREKVVEFIKDHALAWGVGEASVEEISALNIRAASHVAMRRAIEELAVQPDLLLLDGTPAQVHEQIPTVNVVDGDALSVSIAAASIVAKVHRDQLMVDFDQQYPGYGFASHKGYGSKAHQVALAEKGPVAIHRPTYAPIARLLADTEAVSPG